MLKPVFIFTASISFEKFDILSEIWFFQVVLNYVHAKLKSCYQANTCLSLHRFGYQFAYSFVNSQRIDY